MALTLKSVGYSEFRSARNIYKLLSGFRDCMRVWIRSQLGVSALIAWNSNIHLIFNLSKNTRYRLDFSASKHLSLNFSGFLKLNTLDTINNSCRSLFPGFYAKETLEKWNQRKEMLIKYKLVVFFMGLIRWFVKPVNKSFHFCAPAAKFSLNQDTEFCVQSTLKSEKVSFTPFFLMWYVECRRRWRINRMKRIWNWENWIWFNLIWSPNFSFGRLVKLACI